LKIQTIAILNKKMSLFTEMENRKAEQVLSGDLVPVGVGRI
jgi:hypothetical protein